MTSYRERLHVPWDWWLRGVVVVITMAWIARVATTVDIAIATAVITAVITVIVLWRYGSTSIIVDNDWLIAGNARIERKYLGDVEMLNADDFWYQMGPGADPRAYLCTRPYLHQGIRVVINDPNDPTPYWLISSRRSQELSRVLNGES